MLLASGKRQKNIWSSWKKSGKDLKKKEQRLRLHLSPFFRDKPLSSLSTFDLERFKKSRKEEGCTNGTINRELAALSHLFSKAVEWKWLDHRPANINRLKEDGGRMVYLTAAQVAELLNKAAEHQSAFHQDCAGNIHAAFRNTFHPP